jgi:hypothetical protein
MKSTLPRTWGHRHHPNKPYGNLPNKPAFVAFTLILRMNVLPLLVVPFAVTVIVPSLSTLLVSMPQINFI